MYAGIYRGKQSVEIQQIPLPEVGDNDVLIRNIYSSICGTDTAVFQHGPNTGHRISVNQEFGHETVSRVVKIGKNVNDFSIGERVYPYPRYVKADTHRAGTIGGFSEYILVENAKRYHSIYPVDAQISDRLASLIEPFTVGCRAARRGMTPVGSAQTQSAVVFGCGTIGIAAAVALQYFGIQKVMICDYSEYRLQLAKQLGFAACNPARENFEACASDYFGLAASLHGQVPDISCWLDAAGAETIFEDFMNLGKIESKFVCVAVNRALRNLDLLHLTYSQKSIIGSGGYMPEDVNDVQKIMACKKWNLESIITHEFSLFELPKALQVASDVQHAGNVIIRMPSTKKS